MVTTWLATVADLWELPKHGRRYELVRGELREMAAASGEHGEVGAGMAARLWNHVVPAGLGRVSSAETGFVIARDPDTVLVPDVAVVLNARLPDREQRRRFMPVVPDLAVEIISQTERGPQIARKVALYLDAGVAAVWVLEPRSRTVVAHRPDGSPVVLGEDATLSGGTLLPGFRVAVADLFA